METRKMLRSFALATTCLVSMAAYADDFSVNDAPAAAAPAAEAEAAPSMTVGGLPLTGSVTIGVMGVGNGNAYQAGRYNGINAGGLSTGITDMNVRLRAPWDSGDTRYFEFSGENLMFKPDATSGGGVSSSVSSAFRKQVNDDLVNSGSVSLKAGQQGTWAAHLGYDSITYTGNLIDSIYTMSGSKGVLNAPLSAFGGATATTKGPVFTSGTGALTPAQQASLLNAGEQPVLVGTRRDIVTGDFKYILNNWTFTGAFRHEHKEGSMEEAVDESGAYGGTAFAMPINFDTDRYDATASYATRKFQGLVQYTYSHFVDNNLFANLPYPVSNTAAPYQRSAAYSMPPSNDAHYLTVMLAESDLIPKTRLNLNARVGLEQQNNAFAPNSADPTGANLSGVSAASLTGLNTANLTEAGMPGPSLQATVYQIKTSASTRWTKDLSTRLYYAVDGRDMNKSVVDVYGNGNGSSADGTPSGATLLTAVPQSWLKQDAGAEATYVINSETDTRLSGGYRFDKTDRSNAQVGHSYSNTLSIALASEITPDLEGKISLEASNRSGSMTYLGPWASLGQGAAYSGAYYQAPMDSQSIVVRADYTPVESITTGLEFRFKNEDFHYAADDGATLSGGGQGIKNDFSLSIGPDFNYRPSKSVNLHAFYTYEMLFYNISGNGSCATSNTGSCAGSVGYFQNQDTTVTHSLGLSGEWQVTDKLKVKGDYTFSYGSVMFNEFDGVFVGTPTASYQNVANYPDITTVMNAFKLTATYDLMPNVELIGQGIYMGMHNNDWNDTANAVQLSGATNTSLLLTPGYASPNYNLMAALVAVRVKF